MSPGEARRTLAEALEFATAETPVAWARGADAIDVAWVDSSTLAWVCAEGVDRSLETTTLDGESKVLFASGGPAWSRVRVAVDGTSIALAGDSSMHPTEVYMGNLGGEKLVRATESNPWLAERRLARQEVVDFMARDGLRLQGLLIHPLERSGIERVPLVLTVHGGPEAHFANGWLTTYSRPGQVLAGRGYAVFYPNYRGSTGRGLAFAKSSQGAPAG